MVQEGGWGNRGTPRPPLPTPRHWQDLGYLIIYVTGRPDMQKQRVVAWLAQHNFPHGVVSFCDGLVHDPLRHKANFLKLLISEVGPRCEGSGEGAGARGRSSGRAGLVQRPRGLRKHKGRGTCPLSPWPHRRQDQAVSIAAGAPPTTVPGAPGTARIIHVRRQTGPPPVTSGKWAYREP